jgi:subtilisin family serine protease
MTNLKQGIAIFVIAISAKAIAQPVDGTLNWYNQEGQGMFTEKAYKYLKKKESKTVIVGVIDSGVDIEHEDLDGKIWVNSGEIAGNGIDDDNNGYIDDIHGWNF